jgi:hypothetical protein
MPNLKHIDNIGWAVDQLVKHYESGQIKGLMFQVRNHDGTFQNMRTCNSPIPSHHKCPPCHCAALSIAARPPCIEAVRYQGWAWPHLHSF